MIQTLPFFKYQGAGNDFVLVDQRREQWLNRKDQARIQRLCDRRFGIGADGLILLQESPGYDFEMVYFNADGREGSLCGNGGRCIVAFARHLGLVSDSCRFLAVDGPHEARVIRPDWVELKMADLSSWELEDGRAFLDTGSPHYVCFVESLDAVDVVQEGRKIRYGERFRERGTNVNFVQREGEGLRIATYERGVEDETLACGTGVTAAALSALLPDISPGVHRVPVKARGGELEVRFSYDEAKGFRDIWLCGPAVQVFSGSIPLTT